MNNNELFVANRFKKTMLVHNYDNSINFDYYYNIAKPDIVLFEAVEYAIGDNYYSSTQIKNKKFNTVYDKFVTLPKKELCKVDTNEIINKIINSKTKLTNIEIPINNFKYAYLNIDNSIYDFYYTNKKASITLDTELMKKGTINLILIGQNEESQQIINIK